MLIVSLPAFQLCKNKMDRINKYKERFAAVVNPVNPVYSSFSAVKMDTIYTINKIRAFGSNDLLVLIV